MGAGDARQAPSALGFPEGELAGDWLPPCPSPAAPHELRLAALRENRMVTGKMGPCLIAVWLYSGPGSSGESRGARPAGVQPTWAGSQPGRRREALLGTTNCGYC